MTDSQEIQMLEVPEVAVALNLPETTTRKMMRKGELPARKGGRKWLMSSLALADVKRNWGKEARP